MFWSMSQLILSIQWKSVNRTDKYNQNIFGYIKFVTLYFKVSLLHVTLTYYYNNNSLRIITQVTLNQTLILTTNITPYINVQQGHLKPKRNPEL